MQINNSNVFSHRMHSHWKRRMGKVNKLTTNRLTIRNFLSDDTEKCLEGWGRDAGLGKYIIGYPMDYSSMDNFVCALAENKKTAGISPLQDYDGPVYLRASEAELKLSTSSKA